MNGIRVALVWSYVISFLLVGKAHYFFSLVLWSCELSVLRWLNQLRWRILCVIFRCWQPRGVFAWTANTVTSSPNAGCVFTVWLTLSPGVFITKGDVGVGTIVGSAVFNILCIIGVCGFFAGQVWCNSCWPGGFFSEYKQPPDITFKFSAIWTQSDKLPVCLCSYKAYKQPLDRYCAVKLCVFLFKKIRRGRYILAPPS